MLGWQRSLPDLQRGDLLAVMDVGAYGISMASNYNSRSRPAEVMITGKGEYELIRRRERPEDIWGCELNL
jgi:diaminopimelate decarboxylase